MGNFSANITDRIKALIKLRSISHYRLAKETSIPEGTISKSVRGLGQWKSEHLVKLADYFKVSLDWLMKGADVDTELVKESEKQIYGRKYVQVPILGYVECGQPVSTWYEAGNKFIEMNDVAHLSTPFILVAKGDSMKPYINPGDKLLCTEAPDQVKNYTAVIAAFKSPPETYEANAKLIYYDNKNNLITLYSINTKFAPTNHKYSEIYKIFKVVRIIREVK